MIFFALPIVAAAIQAAQVPAAYLPAKPAAETVLAKVNGVPIRVSDVDRLLWDYAGYEVTQDLISYQLIHQEAARLKVAVTPAEVQKAFDEFVTQQKAQIPAGEDFESMLRKQGLPKARVKMQLESNLLMNKIVDAEFKPTEYVKVSTMVFKPKTGLDTDLQLALGQAHDAYTRLTNKGESWDKVVTSSGQIDQLAEHKGLLGWRGIDAFPPVTKEMLKGAKVGLITKPEQTANGIQFFRVEALGVDAKGKDLQDLKVLYEQSAKNSLGKQLQAGAKIEQFFGKTIQK